MATICSTQARRRAGLKVSRGSFLEDQLLKCQVRDRPAKTQVLSLKLLQPLDLVALRAALLSPPSVIRNFRIPYRSDRLGYRSALRRQHLNLPKHCDDLFRLMSRGFLNSSIRP